NATTPRLRSRGCLPPTSTSCSDLLARSVLSDYACVPLAPEQHDTDRGQGDVDDGQNEPRDGSEDEGVPPAKLAVERRDDDGFAYADASRRVDRKEAAQPRQREGAHIYEQIARSGAVERPGGQPKRHSKQQPDAPIRRQRRDAGT